MKNIADPPAFLRSLFECTVAAADPMKVVSDHLPPQPEGRLVVIGAGKASARMAEAVEAHYGPCEGLVITRYGYSRPCEGIEIVEAAHPVPDAAGVDATRRILQLARGLNSDDLVLALISGGGSALLNAPVEGVTLDDIIAVNEALLTSGAPIGDMNAIRKRLCDAKGGKLAAACHPARVLSLMISDVPGDDPAMIASGPTVGDASDTDPQEIVARYNLDLPDSVMSILKKPSTSLAPDDPRLASVENRIIAAPSISLNAAAEMARQTGCDVCMLGDAIEGEARELGTAQARLALEIQSKMGKGDAPILLLSGGECTVTCRGNGVGGPNAEFVLSAAIALNGAQGVHVLACDTDGIDGAAEVAGALAGPDMLKRARNKSLSAQAALDDNDAHSFFAEIDSQIITGPTLTNVNDFRAFLIEPI